MTNKHSLHDIEEAEKTALAATRLAGDDLDRQRRGAVYRRKPDAHVHECRGPDDPLIPSRCPWARIYNPPALEGFFARDYFRALRITNFGVAATCSTPRNNRASLL